MKSTELKDLTVGELQEKIAEMTQSHARMVFNNTVSSLESPISIRHSRRDLARVKTELRKRQIQELA